MKNKQKFLNNIAYCIIFFGIAFVLYISGVGCPIKFVTGISCPGCGITRAVISALKLDFYDAFYFYPPIVLLPIFTMFLIFGKRMPEKHKNLFCWVCLTVIIVVYFIRMFDLQNQIVVFRPRDGFVYKLIFGGR